MTIKDLKSKIQTLLTIYQKNQINAFMISKSSKIEEIKDEIINSGLPHSELIKHIPIDLQIQLDMIILPANNTLNKGYLSIDEFEKSVKSGNMLSEHFWNINKKLATGNLKKKPFSNVFSNYSIDNNGQISIAPLDFIELAKLNIQNSKIPIEQLSENQLFYSLCSSIPCINQATKSMIEAIIFIYECGSKEIALYNIAALSLMINQFQIKILNGKNQSFFAIKSKNILLNENDNYNTYLHILGHAIHCILFGDITPSNFIKLYSICKIKSAQSEEELQVLIEALNNVQRLNNQSITQETNNTEESVSDNNIENVIDEQLKYMDKDALNKLILKYVPSTFQEQYFELLKNNPPKLLNLLRQAILNHSTNYMASSDNINEMTTSLNNDSNIIQGFTYKLNSGDVISLIAGHNESCHSSNPCNIFTEMFANYNVCKAYNDNTIIQLKNIIGEELFNYLESIYANYLNGSLGNAKKNPIPLNSISFENAYIEALNYSMVSDEKKEALLNALNKAIYEDENQILYILFYRLMSEYKYNDVEDSFVNFLTNPSYFKEIEIFQNFLSKELLDKLESMTNFGKVREFITINFPKINNNELFKLRIQEQQNKKDNKRVLYDGEPSYKLVKGYCKKFKTYYTSFGTKISIDENYNDKCFNESIDIALQMFFIRYSEIPTNIKEIQISSKFSNELKDGILSLTSINDLSDELANFDNDEENKRTV